MLGINGTKFLTHSQSKVCPPDAYDVFATNCGKRGRDDLARLAKKRKVELRAELYGAETEVEMKSAQAIFAYEEVRSELNGKKTRATRTWRMVERYGLIGTVERVLTKRKETQGYSTLNDLGLIEFSFESVVSNNPDVFSAEAVNVATQRLG